MTDCTKRETLASRVGFIMLSAGCAIGLGNVWRFPYIVGKYGGGMFVLLYLFFLLLLGFPMLMTEIAIGRGSRANIAGALCKLAQSYKRVWMCIGRIMMFGSLALMMYYTCVSGWLYSYMGYYARGVMDGLTNYTETNAFFTELISSPVRSSGYMLLAVFLGTVVCMFGVQKGIERCVKIMMSALLVLILVLAGYALTMPGAAEGISFYLKPSLTDFSKAPMETVFAAMGQAFFTLSLGVGSMTIFGSYMDWKKPLALECTWIILLDTFVAFCSGIIIFPICKSYGVDVAQGPGLLFVSMPNALNAMSGGRIWGSLFFLFMSLAALTTIVAVFENMIAYLQDEYKVRRKNATLLVSAAVAMLSLPCVFGYNLLSFIQPLGENSTILDFEDFIVSMNLLPIGALVMLIFCFSKDGWGKDNFVAEMEAGQKWKIPEILLTYWRYILPVVIFIIFIAGYWQMFF